MASSGGTTGTPTSSTASVAQPILYTLLSLDRYAKIMGINPAHFWTAVAVDLNPEVFPLGNRCSNIWPHYSWQNADQVSHYDLAIVIKQAEDEIARYLNFYPAPKWITNEVHKFNGHYNRTVYTFGYNVRQQLKSVNAKWGKLISPGQRGVSLVGTVTSPASGLVYTDDDSDGLSETATVSVSTTLTDANEINVYFQGKSGHPDWEIREARSKEISGGTFTAKFDSWLFIDPDLREAYPTSDGFEAINISTTGNYVSTVDVYREYTNVTEKSAELFWERQPDSSLSLCSVCGGIGCQACTLVTQDGCCHIRDVRRSLLIPQAATYDEDNEVWERVTMTECREPDQVKVWYYAGNLADEFLSGFTHQRLSYFWAQTIAWLATARLERPLCDCGNVTTLANNLMVDLAVSGGEEARFIPAESLTNPFGTKKGEVMAWQRVSKFAEKVQRGYAV